ncbi:MAG TPA: type IX secretion system membrane protein PorP/SprF [Flavobacteriales bacterium]|nr:type IX secretion system membrane protein PorP/SprF [Flavobacteriales bacterium]
MVKIKHILYIGIVVLTTLNMGIAQDIHFSQFSESPATLNPACIGAFDGEFRVVGNVREQWKNVGDYSTYAGSFDMIVLRDKITNGSFAVGANFITDKSGDLDFSTNTVNLSISANKSISKKNNFALGLQGGFGQRGVTAGSELQQWDNQYVDGFGYDSNVGSGEDTPVENFVFADFSTGLLWRYSGENIGFHSGFSIFHLNQPKQNFLLSTGKQLLQMAFHAGSKIDIKDKPFSLIPKVLFLKNGAQIETNAGMLFKYVLQEGSEYAGEKSETSVYIGGWYRMGDAAIANIKMDYMNFSVGVSYDFNISSYKTITAGNGGFEIAISYLKPLLTTRKKRRSLL